MTKLIDARVAAKALPNLAGPFLDYYQDGQTGQNPLAAWPLALAMYQLTIEASAGMSQTEQDALTQPDIAARLHAFGEKYEFTSMAAGLAVRQESIDELTGQLAADAARLAFMFTSYLQTLPWHTDPDTVDWSAHLPNTAAAYLAYVQAQTETGPAMDAAAQALADQLLQLQQQTITAAAADGQPLLDRLQHDTTGAAGIEAHCMVMVGPEVHHYGLKRELLDWCHNNPQRVQPGDYDRTVAGLQAAANDAAYHFDGWVRIQLKLTPSTCEAPPPARRWPSR